eukprot:234289_1
MSNNALCSITDFSGVHSIGYFFDNGEKLNGEILRQKGNKIFVHFRARYLWITVPNDRICSPHKPERPHVLHRLGSSRCNSANDNCVKCHKLCCTKCSLIDGLCESCTDDMTNYTSKILQTSLQSKYCQDIVSIIIQFSVELPVTISCCGEYINCGNTLQIKNRFNLVNQRDSNGKLFYGYFTENDESDNENNIPYWYEWTIHCDECNKERKYGDSSCSTHESMPSIISCSDSDSDQTGVCDHCGKYSNIRICQTCRSGRYCSKRCQKQCWWRTHCRTCTRL